MLEKTITALKTTNTSAVETTRANVSNSKPKSGHCVFTHFPKDSNCEVCRTTKITRARCKNRPVTTRRWNPTSNFARRASYSGSQNVESHKRRCGRNSILLAEFPASIPKAWKSLHRQFEGVHQSVSGPTMNARHGYSSSFRNQRDRGNSCPTSKRTNMNSGGSQWPTDEWWDCAMEC